LLYSYTEPLVWTSTCLIYFWKYLQFLLVQQKEGGYFDIIIIVDCGRRRIPLCPHLLQLVLLHTRITYTQNRPPVPV